MKFANSAATLALAVTAAACGQGNSDNVMAPEANALQPADVNAALGPEVANTPDMSLGANDLAANDANSTQAPNINEQPDEPGTPTNNTAN